MGRVEFAQHADHILHALGPQLWIVPDVRIVVAFELGRLAEPRVLRLDQRVRDRKRRLALGELFEQVGHAAFEVQAVVEDHVGGVELLDVGRHGAVEMRIDARAHQASHLQMLAADVVENVGDGAGGA